MILDKKAKVNLKKKLSKLMKNRLFLSCTSIENNVVYLICFEYQMSVCNHYLFCKCVILWLICYTTYTYIYNIEK